MRKLKIEFTKIVEIEIDDSNHVVQEYDDNELVSDLISYNFGTGLPVVQSGGVRVVDTNWKDMTFEEI